MVAGIVVLALFSIVSLIAGIVLYYRKKLHPAIRVPLFLLCIIAFLISLLWGAVLIRDDQKDKGARTFIRSVIGNPSNAESIPFSIGTPPDEKKKLQDTINNLPKCHYKVDLATVVPGGQFFCYDVHFDDGKTFFVTVDVWGGKYALYRINEVKKLLEPGKSGDKRQ